MQVDHKSIQSPVKQNQQVRTWDCKSCGFINSERVELPHEDYTFHGCCGRCGQVPRSL